MNVNELLKVNQIQIKFIFTLWLFNIAMENGTFIDDFPIKPSIYEGFSMAMLNSQMVFLANELSFSMAILCISSNLRPSRSAGPDTFSQLLYQMVPSGYVNIENWKITMFNGKLPTVNDHVQATFNSCVK